MEPTSTFANLENLENLTEETCTGRGAARVPEPSAGSAPGAAEPAEEAQAPAPAPAAPRRSYGLLETVRHPDDDLPEDDFDPTSMVLAQERPDVWEIGIRL